MESPDLGARPFTLAEIVDRSVALARRHFRPLFVAMLVVQAPAVLLARALPDPLQLLAAAGDPGRTAEVLSRALRPLGGVFLALVALQLVATAAAAAIVAPSLDPARPGVARPGRARTAWAVGSAALVQVLLVGAAPVVGLLPGLWLTVRALSFPTALAGAAGALVGSLGLFVVVTLRLMVVPAVAAVEGRAGFAALARSSRLMSPRPGARFWERPGVRASLVLLAMVVLVLAVNGLAGLPRLVALRLAGGAGLEAMAAHLPLALEIPLTLVEALASAAVQPFSLVAVVVFYFDRRARTEALDLERWAARLAEPG